MNQNNLFVIYTNINYFLVFFIKFLHKLIFQIKQVGIKDKYALIKYTIRIHKYLNTFFVTLRMHAHTSHTHAQLL